MACEHFLSGKYPLCTVVRGLMTPSLWEMHTYCTSEHSSACTLYRQYTASQEKVALEAAVALIGKPAGTPARRAALCEPSLPAENRAPSPVRSWRSDSRG